MKLTKMSVMNEYEKIVAIGFSTPQLVLTGMAGWLFAFTVVQGFSQLMFSPLSISRLKLTLISFPATLGLLVIPIFLLSIIIKNIRLPRRGKTPDWRSILKIVLNGIGLLAIIIYSLCSIAIFIILDLSFAITEVCLSIAMTCVFASFLFNNEFLHLKKNRRYSVIAFLILVLLSLERIDLNSAKPFTRDLYKVKRGMTGVEVENIMAGHIKNWVQDESEHFLHLNPAFTGEAWFRYTHEAWGNAGWGKVVFADGRVQDVEVCLCD
jgi:hypothetical protein